MRHIINVVIISIVIAFVAGITLWVLSDIREGDVQHIAPTIKESALPGRGDDEEPASPDFDFGYQKIEAMDQTFCADPYATTQCQNSCDGALWEIKGPAHGFADCQKRCCAIAYKDDPEMDKEFEEAEE